MSVVSEEVRLQQDGLAEHVMRAVKSYLATTSTKDASLNLYQLIIEEVEAPLFRTVMEMTRYNQSRAARVLGVSRGTLRTKLKRYFDEEFIGTREE
ncbi:MAG: Fis family transcriptional regulator [Gammaproteobacteria bacterium]|jgi:Fis family transcriptional regulator, factor for inversion stimulation protein|nr:Fis family transcriptional regulator [Gammaproteobacteria bacterium]MCH9716078.1 Fis family transcriptional regulator [Gammaproteobacteria bacterium]MCH9763673.1 Fis family transcriptional regulator [Gammaproteobacteria bacterium]